jgi:hypothetical protein
MKYRLFSGITNGRRRSNGDHYGTDVVINFAKSAFSLSSAGLYVYIM